MVVGVANGEVSARVLSCCTLLVALCLTESCSNGTNGIGDFGPVGSRDALTADEADAVSRMRVAIDAAEALIADPRLSEAERSALRGAVAGARYALNEFMERRSQGSARRETLEVIGVAAAGIVANDATIVGAADDVLLPVAALAAMTTWILTKPPATYDDVERAWRNVGKNLDALARAIKAAEPKLAPPPLALPRSAPANQNQPGPVNQNQPGQPLAPVPVPAPRTDDRRKRDECKPRRVCPHKGGNTKHNDCADSLTQTQYLKCDVLVNGKHFDALDVSGVLWEVKTDNWKTYAQFVKDKALSRHVDELKDDQKRAMACGFEFKVAVGDWSLKDDLDKKFRAQKKKIFKAPIVEYKQPCDRTISP